MIGLNKFLFAVITFSLVTQSFAMQAVRDNYRWRHEAYNPFPADDRIPGYTGELNKIFRNKPSNKPAKPEEKRDILKAVMATALIHGDDMSLPAHGIDPNNVDLFRHYEILRITQKISQKLAADLVSDSLSDVLNGIPNIDEVRSLEIYGGITTENLIGWFNEALNEHIDGWSQIENSPQSFIDLNHKQSADAIDAALKLSSGKDTKLAPLAKQFIRIFCSLTKEEQRDIAEKEGTPLIEYFDPNQDWITKETLIYMLESLNAVRKVKARSQERIAADKAQKAIDDARKEANREKDDEFFRENRRKFKEAEQATQKREAQAAKEKEEAAKGKAAAEALKNYTGIIEMATAPFVGLPGNAFDFLERLKDIGAFCYLNDMKEQADWIKTLILTFADLTEAGQAALRDRWDQIRAARRENDTITNIDYVLDLYLYLEQEMNAGRIALKPKEAVRKETAIPSAKKASIPDPKERVWSFWRSSTGTGTKQFRMPAGLNYKEQEYVSFFMDNVMPKLYDLFKQKKIGTQLVEGVIRAASMGLIGITEKDFYLNEFERRLDDDLKRADSNGKITRESFYTISPETKDKESRRFAGIDDVAPFFGAIGPTFNRITTFNALHAQDESDGFIKEYNALGANQRTPEKIRELKDKQKNILEAKLIGLPTTIQQTFSFMLDKKCSDDIWVRFIEGFNTRACYDGTYDQIVPIGTEISASDDGKNQRSPNKIFAKMLTKIPADLQGVLRYDRMDLFVNAAKKASAGNAETPSNAFFESARLETYFQGNTDAVRNVVGTGSNGRCKLTDKEMLELIYWGYVMTVDGIDAPKEIRVLFTD